MPTVRPRGDGFQAIVRVQKNGVQIFSESKMHATEKLAWDWARRLEAKVKAEGAPARQRQRMTLADLIAKYRHHRAEVKPLRRTVLAELDQLEYWLGTERLDACTAERFVKFARDRRAGGAGPATVLHNLSTLRSIFSTAKPAFGIHVDQAPIVEAIKTLQMSGHVAKSKSRDRRVTDKELELLVEEFIRMQGHPTAKIPMHVFVRLAIALPRRREDLCYMEWKNLTGSVLVLEDTKHPDTPRTERIPVPPEALKIIQSLPIIDARIFPYEPESVSSAFQRACGRLGIEDLRLHDLRHEGICRLFEMGLSIPEVSMISGHMSWTTLKRYTHLRAEDVAETMNARQ